MVSVTGKRTLIQEVPFYLLRVILRRARERHWAPAGATHLVTFLLRRACLIVRQRGSIPRSPWETGQVLSPHQPRGAPDLRAGPKLLALINRPQSDPNLLGIFILSRRIDGRSAIGTEKLQPSATVVRGLDIKPGLAGRYLKLATLRADGHPVGGSRQSLASRCSGRSRRLVDRSRLHR